MLQASSYVSFWGNGSNKKSLTAKKIIAALDADLKQSQLSMESNKFIRDFIMPYLEIAEDTPQQLLKATMNIIYMECRPDHQYRKYWEGTTWKVMPAIPYYPQAETLYPAWRNRFEQWHEVTQPYVYINSGCRLSDNIDYSTFKECFLSAIPEDGMVFIPNADMLINLQALVQKCIVPEEQSLNEIVNGVEMVVMRPINNK